MTLTVQPYSGERDFDAMRSILVAGRAHARHSGYIHIGDLNWWLYYILPRQYDLREIAYVWRAGSEVVGWTLFTPDEGLFDLFVHPEERRSERREHMLAWTEERIVEIARREGLSEVRAEVFEDDQAWSGLLQAHGFSPDESRPSLYTVRSLEHIPDPVLPDGFTLRSMGGEEDIEQRASVHFAAFSPRSKMTADKYRAFRRAPDYRADLDVITVAPDGRIASFAMAWVDTENEIGLFEPVGTHPDFQRRGLARATLFEALHRMKAAGAREALVYPYANDDARHLYFSVGFEQRNRFIGYRKPS